MQVISIIDNILDPRIRAKTTNYSTLIEFLQDEYPHGFGNMPTVIYEDFHIIPVEDYDLKFKPDTAYTIMHQPAVGEVIIGALFAGASGFWATLAAAAIDYAVIYAVNYIINDAFSPNIPSGIAGSADKSDNKASSVYNLNSNQNSVRLGQPIPILYGRTRSYPSIIEEPYFRYKDNEMYMYQMMVVTAGKGQISELLVADSKEVDLGPDDVIYKVYYDDSLTAGVIKADVDTTFGDPNYHMRVKTLPEVSGLELRGTPAVSSFIMSFSGTTIQFYTYANGLEPDLSSIVSGTKITISGTLNNDGIYIASGSPTGLAVPIGSKEGDAGWVSFTAEPATTINTPPDSPTILHRFRVGYNIDGWTGYSDRVLQYTVIDLQQQTVTAYAFSEFIPGRVINVDGTVYQIVQKLAPYTDMVMYTLNPIPTVDASNLTSVGLIASEYYAQFATSYGAYTLNPTVSDLDSVEVDIEYPRGIYNSDTAGNFTDRSILLEYNLIGNIETGWTRLAEPGNITAYTETLATNTPQRRTYPLPIPVGMDDSEPIKLRIRRVSPETSDIKGQDQAIVSRVKTLYIEPDITDYGDITLLWARLKATNGISSKGQFQLNAWVTRTDVLPDITSVITDLYTNTSYGAKLPAADLQLPEMYVEGTVIDPATDSGAVQTVSEYYIKDEIYNDTGLVLTATEYYIFHPTAAFLDYFIYWDGVIVYSSGFELSVGVEYTTGDGWYYVIDQASPVEETHYSVRRYNKYTLPYSVYWGGVLVYSSASLLSVGVPYLSGVDNYYYQVYDEAPAEDTQYPIRRFKYLSSEYYEEFNGAIDASITVMDAISMIATAGRFTAYLDGRNIKIRKDEPQLIRTSLFNETNIIKDSFKLSYLFGESDSTDGVLVKYRSPDDFTEQQKTYPLTSTNPETMELIGCTDPVLADMAAQYGWKSKQARKKIVSFKSDEQALIPNYLDRIGVSHNVPKWGQGGQIIGFSGQDVFLDDNYLAAYSPAMPCEPYLVCSDVMFPECVAPTDTPLSIIFRAPNGAVSDIYPCTRTSSSSVSVTGVLPIWMYAGEDYDKTYFSIGETINIIRDFTVTEIKPSGENQYEITGINYDPSIYIYE